MSNIVSGGKILKMLVWKATSTYVYKLHKIECRMWKCPPTGYRGTVWQISLICNRLFAQNAFDIKCIQHIFI